MEGQLRIQELKVSEQGQALASQQFDIEKAKERLAKVQNLYEKEKKEKKLMEVQVSDTKTLIHKI